jgi:hypothetical protein
MPLPAAASVSVARLLTGPVRTVTVTASLPAALYVSTLDPDIPAICLAAADAVRVPCALVLGPGVAVPMAPIGTRVWLGEGQLRLGPCGTSAVVTRWWRAARPRLIDIDAVPGAIFSSALAPELLDFIPLASDLAGALASSSDLAPAVRALLGRGPGLTPLGDDVLAGALVTLQAADISSLATAVRGALTARPGTATTPVSAALLAHACRGECVPQLATVLDAVAGAGDLSLAVDELLQVGHSSGSGLLLGVRIGLEAWLAARRGPDGNADRTPRQRARATRASHRIGRSAE